MLLPDAIPFIVPFLPSSFLNLLLLIHGLSQLYFVNRAWFLIWSSWAFSWSSLGFVLPLRSVFFWL